MAALLYSVLGWLATNFLARMLVGAGLTLLTYKGLGGLVSSYLNSLSGTLSGAPAAALDFMALAGVNQALGIVGSAMLASAAVFASGRILGIATKS